MPGFKSRTSEPTGNRFLGSRFIFSRSYRSVRGVTTVPLILYCCGKPLTLSLLTELGSWKPSQLTNESGTSARKCNSRKELNSNLSFANCKWLSENMLNTSGRWRCEQAVLPPLPRPLTDRRAPGRCRGSDLASASDTKPVRFLHADRGGQFQFREEGGQCPKDANACTAHTDLPMSVSSCFLHNLSDRGAQVELRPFLSYHAISGS
jgi:hypothetical protein